MIKLTIIIFVSLFLAVGNTSKKNNDSVNEIVVPKTNRCLTIITDGQIENVEWVDAKRITLSEKDSVYLFAKQNDKFIFLAIRTPFRMISYVDMYFDYGDNYIHNIHSSSQLGERILVDTAWNDQSPTFHFGRSDQWYANEMRFDRIKAQELITANPTRDRNTMQWETTFPYDGYEYILKKSKFNKPRWKIRIEIKTGMPGYQNVIYPATSELKRSAGWADLIIE